MGRCSSHRTLRRWHDVGGRRVRTVLNRLTERVKVTFVTSAGADDGLPVWPPLSQLLFELAQPGVSAQDSRYAQLAQELAGFIPVGFAPQGLGDMKVLVAYPGAENDEVVWLLQELLLLPPVQAANLSFRATAGNSLEVTMFRSQMGLADQRGVVAAELLDGGESLAAADRLPAVAAALPIQARSVHCIPRTTRFDWFNSC